MRCPCYPIGRINIFWFSFLLWYVITTWQDYNECYAPIQLFLAMTFGASILVLIFLPASIFMVLFQPCQDPDDFPYSDNICPNFLLYWIVNPFVIYLSVQGWIWQIQNLSKTPDCLQKTTIPWFPWVWLVWISNITIFITANTIFNLIYWIQRRREGRRADFIIRLLMNAQEQGFQALDQPAFPNNRIGLLPSETERIPTQTLSQAFIARLGLPDYGSCSICFEDYNIGDQVLVLPICNHYFHPPCVSDWLKSNLLCPTCRANVRTNLDQNLQNQV